MTFPIPSTSPKAARAERFARELNRAMKARDVGARPVIDAIGTGRSAIRLWRSGRGLPRLETCQRLAAALDWPRLEVLGRELRTKACEVDAVPFVDDTGSDNRRFCSPSCQRVAEKRRMGSTVDKRAAVAERRLVDHRAAVAAYCAGCEPSGICITADCALRPVSPLPLGERRTTNVEVAASRRRNRWEDHREADSVRQAGVWARYSPEERQARIDRAAEASKVARGLVPA